MMASILTPVNSFWSRRFWKFWRLKLTLNPHPTLGPHFGTAKLIEPFLTHLRLTQFCKVFAFVFETDAFVN